MARPMPLLSVSDGNIECEDLKKVYPCTRENLLKLGGELYDLDVESWICSSSVDHPDEYGVTEDLDIRGILEEGYMRHHAMKFEAHITKVAKEENLTEDQVRTVLKRFGVIEKDTD